jgi:hypothetical protein
MDFTNDDGVVDPLLAEDTVDDAEVDPNLADEALGDEEDESPVSVYDMNEDGELEPA